MKRIRLAALLLVVFSSLLYSTSTIHSQRQLDVEQRVNSLLARMTVAEKLGQLQQLDGEANGNFRPEHLDLIRKGLLGSTLNVRGVQRTNQMQRVAMNESRLKIPVLFGFDAIHGYRTIFPIPLGEAASFDPSLAERSAAVAAQETNNSGVRWTFAPMVDIARDPRWGRITEGAGEDPFLGAAFARARVRGFQGNDYGAPDKVLACAKHWVAYGAAEGGRDYNTTDLSEQTLREIYFPPVAGIKAKVSPQTKVGYERGCDVKGESTAGFDEAVNLARSSDVAVVFVGELAEMVGEAASRASLDLPFVTRSASCGAR